MRNVPRSLVVVAAGVLGLATLAGPVTAAPTPTTSAQSPDRPPQKQELAPVMLVLDASGSMRAKDPGGGTKMDAAKDAVRTLADDAPDCARLGLTVYGAGTGNSASEKAAGCRDVQVRHKIGARDGDGLVRSIAKVKPRGYTPIGAALKKAAAALPAEGPRSIVLVSDGEDTCAPPDPCDVAKDLSKQGVDLKVHSVGFDVDSRARKQLSCVASSTGGSYVGADDADDLDSALNRVTQQALRSYEASGTPIRGGADQQGAPAVKPGAYLDSFAAGDVKYYALDVPAGYTAWSTATGIFPAGESMEVLSIQRYATDGSECGQKDFEVKSRPKSLAIAGDTWTAPTGASPSAEPCDRPGRQVLRVEREGGSGRGRTPIPVELIIGLEPPVTADHGPQAGSEVAYAEPGGARTRLVGGASFATAATVERPGHYRDVLRPGEFVFFRVRLEWGQGLAYRMRVGDSDDEGVLSLTTRRFGPARQEIGYADGLVYTGSADKVPDNKDALATMPVRYDNRTDDSGEPQSVAGWYYIMVGAISSSSWETPVPVDLDVSVSGRKEPGPTYVGAPGADVFGGATGSPAPSVSGTPQGARKSAPAEEPAGPFALVKNGGPVLWIGGPLIVIGAGAVLFVLLFARRRRRRGPPHYGG